MARGFSLALVFISFIYCYHICAASEGLDLSPKPRCYVCTIQEHFCQEPFNLTEYMIAKKDKLDSEGHVKECVSENYCFKLINKDGKVSRGCSPSSDDQPDSCPGKVTGDKACHTCKEDLCNGIFDHRDSGDIVDGGSLVLPSLLLLTAPILSMIFYH